MDDLIAPHGGKLVDLIVEDERASDLHETSRAWPSWSLADRQMCDLELLLNGGFSPLEGFMGKADYDLVYHTSRLANGTLWPMPITLDVSEELADLLYPGDSLALRNSEGVMIAVVRVDDVWKPDRVAEAEAVFGTRNVKHPGVRFLLERTYPCYVGGRVEGITLPHHYDFKPLRLTPAELRTEFARQGWRQIVALQTRNPMHRAHHELTLRAMKEVGANLLIHPVVGMTNPGDINHYTRVRCYQQIINRYPQFTVKLSLLPLAMRMGGPREAVWHAIIRKNYGCTHLIIGRDHASPGKTSSGEPFYGPYDAQVLLREQEEELGVKMVPLRMMVYLREGDTYVPEDKVPEGVKPLSISGTELRERLSAGREIPEWFTFPEVARELQRSHLPRHRQGFTIFLTGLSGAGKSTIANILVVRFLEIGQRSVTLLDGDMVRKNLSSELGFSKEHRDINIRRIGFVASEITKNGGIAICAPIAPYGAVRKEVRSMIAPLGGFALVHVSTPLEVCERRDCKGLYTKARTGIIKEFTGISDPYEEPEDAEVVIDTTNVSPDEAAQMILFYLEKEAYLPPM